MPKETAKVKLVCAFEWCPRNGTPFEREASRVRWAEKMHWHGPFCSRSCATKDHRGRAGYA